MTKPMIKGASAIVSYVLAVTAAVMILVAVGAVQAGP